MPVNLRHIAGKKKQRWIYYPRSRFPTAISETAKGGRYEVEILSVLRELFGEAIHIFTLNASTLGALLSNFIDRLKNSNK